MMLNEQIPEALKRQIVIRYECWRSAKVRHRLPYCVVCGNPITSHTGTVTVAHLRTCSAACRHLEKSVLRAYRWRLCKQQAILQKKGYAVRNESSLTRDIQVAAILHMKYGEYIVQKHRQRRMMKGEERDDRV